MRLQHMYFLCKQALEQWEDPSWETKLLPGSNTVDYYLFSNLGTINNVLQIIEPIPIFHDQINGFHQLAPFLDYGKMTAALAPPMKADVTQRLAHIKNQMETICEVCESLGYEQTMQGVDVKFPDGLSLAEFAKMANRLDGVFAQSPILHKEDVQIRFTMADRGSCWLSFALIGAGAAAALRCIAELTDKAVMIRDHIATCKQQESAARQMEMGEEILRNMIDTHKQMTNLLLQKTAEEMAKEHDITEPEAIERQKHTLKELADMMSMGLEIYGAIAEHTEVKAAFPPVERQRLSDGMLKLLMDKQENDPAKND